MNILSLTAGETDVQPEATPSKEAPEEATPSKETPKEATPTETDVPKVPLASPPDEAIPPSATEKTPPPAPVQENTDQGQEEKSGLW